MFVFMINVGISCDFSRILGAQRVTDVFSLKSFHATLAFVILGHGHELVTTVTDSCNHSRYLAIQVVCSNDLVQTIDILTAGLILNSVAREITQKGRGFILACERNNRLNSRFRSIGRRTANLSRNRVDQRHQDGRVSLA
jgi:hypothetical protein